MALAALATPADLEASNIDVSNEVRVNALLGRASAAVRRAAGVPITRGTFTVELLGTLEEWLKLPGQPVVSVAAIDIDGTAVTDHKLIEGKLWRLNGWQANSWEPSKVTLTITGGLVKVPEDIVDLVCSMVGKAMADAEDGYESKAGVAYESIDDYRKGYAQDAEVRAGVMELPSGTRELLASRFGGGAYVVKSR